MENNLLARVGNWLAGVPVTIPTQVKSLNVESFLYRVAEAKLEKTGGCFVPPNTKMLMPLTREQSEKVMQAMVQKWVAFANTNRKDTSFEETIKALLNYREG